MPRLTIPSRGVGKDVPVGQAVAALLALSALGACEIPTGPPAFESRWIVPAEETRFGVAELLPGDVSLTSDSSAFIVDFAAVTFSETLGSLCPPCAAANGLTVPKPAFNGSVVSVVDFPPEVSALTIVDGVVHLRLESSLNFDPIRPASGVFGDLSVEITDDADGDVLGTLLIEGETTAFGPGGVVMDSVVLGAGTVDGGLRASVQVNSPLGDNVTMDASQQIAVTATPTNVQVSSVDIDVGGRVVSLDPVSLDLEDVDTEVIDRIVSGAFVLDVVNPFTVAADFQLTISGPTIATIQKSVSIGAVSQTSTRIDFTQAELQSFLGEPNVVLSGGATVDAGAGTITVAPGDELVLDASLDLTLRVGG